MADFTAVPPLLASVCAPRCCVCAYMCVQVCIHVCAGECVMYVTCGGQRLTSAAAWLFFFNFRQGLRLGFANLARLAGPHESPGLQQPSTGINEHELPIPALGILEMELGASSFV